MSDEDFRGKIPGEFSLRELHQEAVSSAQSRRDILAKPMKRSAEMRFLMEYSIARLDAIAKLLAKLHNEEVRARKEAKAEDEKIDRNRVVEEDW